MIMDMIMMYTIMMRMTMVIKKTHRKCKINKKKEVLEYAKQI